MNSELKYLSNGTALCACPTCDEKYALVCASDGSTYASECWMKREACLKKTQDVVVAKQGACGEWLYLCRACPHFLKMFNIILLRVVFCKFAQF